MKALSKRERNHAERRRQLLDAALRVFARMGYSGTTMEAVAAEAGTTKPTLYKQFDSKMALFEAVMQARRADMQLRVNPTDGTMVAALHSFAWRYAETVMCPDLLSLARLIIGEAARFPEIGRAYQASGPDQLLSDMIRWLEAYRDAGALTFEDAELAAQDLWGLILSAPRTKALNEPDYAPDRAALSRYVNNGLNVFLRAYSTTPTEDLAMLSGLIKTD